MKFFNILIIITLLMFGSNCGKDNDDKKNMNPVIYSIVPNEAFKGDTVNFKIIGENFLTGDIVMIGDITDASGHIKKEKVFPDTIFGILYPVLEPGVYDVRVRRSIDIVAKLENAFTIKEK